MLITRIGLRQGARSSLKSQVRFQNDKKQSENKPSIFDIPVSEEEINQLNADLTEGIKEFRFPQPVDRKKIFTDIAQTIIREYKPIYEDFKAGKINADRVPFSVHNLPESQRGNFIKFHESQQDVQQNFTKTHGLVSGSALDRYSAVLNNKNAPMKKDPIHVAVTGASGQIGYALLFRIASGDMFGPHQPVVLKLLELPQAMNSLKGVVMELRDCAFPLVSDIVMTDNPEKAFEAVDYALLVGATPRKEGMERADLLLKNAEIFSIQGKALNTAGKGKDTRVAVVGNPANTNALIAQRNAPKIPAENFSAMTRLDHSRGLAQLAEKAKVHLEDISRFVIWGNHSATQFPDISHAYINGKPADEVINDPKWVNDVFIPTVQQRGAAVIKARGSSSAASAAGALVDHIYDWHHGTHTEWASMAVFSKGEYGVEQGLFYSYPVVINDFKEWTVVKNLPITEWAAQKMEATHKELQQERDGVAKFLPK